MDFTIGLGIGVVIGIFLGIVVISLCFVTKDKEK